jgi:hypothetical protein
MPQGPVSAKIWEGIMNLPHCPHMEAFGFRLIEAYRHDQEFNLTPGAGLLPSDDVMTLHHAITEHRSTCLICRKVEDAAAIARFHHDVSST